MKITLPLLLILFLFWGQSWSQSTETFETESLESTIFTDNGQQFQIISQAPAVFDVFSYSGGGWSGTGSDNRFIDNSGSTFFNTPVQFHIVGVGGNTFTLKSLYLFLSQSNLSLNVNGSLTITGKLGGVQKFNLSANPPFNTSMSVNNGFTFIDLANFGGQNVSNISIDEYVITTTANIAYVALDAMTWAPAACPTPSISKSNQTNIACFGGATGAASVNASSGVTYDWSPGNPTGDGTPSVTGLTAGVWTCTVTSSCGATNATTFTITQPSLVDQPTAVNQEFCITENATIADLLATGTDIKWYNLSTGGTALATTAAITTGTYYVSQTVNGCESARTAVAVTLNITPKPIIADKVFCYGATAAELSGASTNLKWYYSQTGGTQIPNTDILQTGYYYASETANSCESERTRVFVRVNYNIFSLYNEPIAVSGFTYDIVAQTLPGNQSTTRAFNTFNDYLISSSVPGSTSFMPTNNRVISEYTGIAYNLQSYTENNSFNLRINESVTVNFPANISNSNVIYLLGASSQIGTKFSMLDVTINFTDGSSQVFSNRIIYDWYYQGVPYAIKGLSRISGNTTLQNSLDNPRLFDIVLPLDVVNRTKTISNIKLVSGAASDEAINIMAVSRSYNEANNQATVCNGTVISDLQQFPSTLLWYSSQTGGTALARTSLLNAGTYYVSMKVENCETDRYPITINLNTAPLPTATAQNFCTSATVANLVATGTNLKWYDVATFGTELTSTTSLQTGSYYVTQTVNGCESERVAVQVSINTMPNAPTIVNQEFCYGATVNNLIINHPNTNWYFGYSGGTPLAATEVLQTGYYFASQINGSCESARDQVFVYINYNIFSLFNEPVAVTGFNHDIVAQTINGSDSATRLFDYFNHYLVSSDVPGATNFLPNNNEVISEYSGIKYKLESYNVNNAFSLFYNESSIVNFPANVSNSNVIYLLAASSQGSTQFSRLDVTINFTDGTTQFFANRLIYDWFTVGVPHAIKGIGRLISGDRVENNSDNPKLFDIVLPLDFANRTKTIQSISLRSRSNEKESINVMAVSRSYNEATMSATVCASTKISDLSQFPTTLLWYESASSTTPIDRNSLLTNNIYYVSMKVGNCETDRVSITINHLNIPLPTADAQTFCNSAIVSNLVAIGTNLKWYNVVTGGTELLDTASLSTGTYYVSQKIDNCESERVAVQVIINSIPNAPTANAQTFCNSAIVSNLVAIGTNLKWYNDATGGTELLNTSSLSTGTYYVSQTINDCESPRTLVEVTITNIIASISTQTNVLCFGENTGNATATATGGSGTYSYSWNTVPVQNTQTANNLSVGTYTVTITDANGCTATANVSITQPASGLVASIDTQTNVLCFGENTGNATATATGGSGTYTYSWNTVPVQNTPTASNLSAGTYTVTITDGNGCSNTADVIITEPTMLAASITKEDVTCFDFATGSATITANTGTAPYTYLWNDALNQTTATATNLIAGTYTVTITDANRCTITETVIINQPIQVIVTASTLDQTICSGESTSILFSSTTVGTTYNWTVVSNGVSGAIAGSGNNISQLLTTTTANVGTVVYTIVPTSPSGCIGNSIQVSVKVNPNPVVVATPNTQTICNGDNSIINLSSATPGTTFSWTVIQDGVTGATSGTGNTITNTLNLTNNTAGQVIYRITPTANGCVGESIDVTIHVNPFVRPTFTQVASICAGNNLDVLPTTSLNGIEGTWSPALNNMQTTTYTFTPNVQNSGILCHNTTTMTIVVHPIPVVNITANATTLCSGSSLQLNFTSSVAGTTFNYQVVSTNVVGATNGTGNALSHVLTNSTTSNGEVVYAVTPIANGCEGQTVYYIVNVTPLPTLTMVVSQNEICNGESVSATFRSNISGTTFNWQVQANNVVGAVSGSGSNFTQNLTTTSLNGEIVKYIVTPVYNGCEGTSQEFEILIKPRPVVYAPQNLAVCSGENVLINLTASHPNVTYSYRIVQNNVIGAEAGTDATIDQTLETITEAVGFVTYYITPSLNGCVGETVEVRVQVNPLTTINLIDGYVCYDSNTGDPISTFDIPTGLSRSNYSFVWYKDNQIIPNENGSILSANSSGIYHVEVTNLATGCVSLSDFAAVGENYNAQSIHAYVNNSFTHGTIVVDVVGPGVYEYQLNGAGYQSNPIFTRLLPGIYTVEVRDTVGCTYEMYQLEILSFLNFFTPNGDGIHDTWNVWSLANQTDAEIHIFDRYGAFIKQIKPSGEGWNGTRNGVPLPSTDYWFTLRYRDGIDNSIKEFKSHFSLKR